MIRRVGLFLGTLLVSGLGSAQDEPKPDPYRHLLKEDQAREGTSLPSDLEEGDFELDLAPDIDITSTPPKIDPRREETPKKEERPEETEAGPSILPTRKEANARFLEFLKKKSKLPIVEEASVWGATSLDGGETVTFQKVDRPTAGLPFFWEIRFANPQRDDTIELLEADAARGLSLEDDPFADDPEERNPSPPQPRFLARRSTDDAKVYRTDLFIADAYRSGWRQGEQKPLDLSATTRKKLKKLLGKWKIRYEDADLGSVEGVALFGIENRRFFGEVAVQSPESGKSYLLRQEHFELRGDEVLLSLSGFSPPSRKRTESQLGKRIAQAQLLDRSYLRLKISLTEADREEYETLAKEFTAEIDREIHEKNPKLFKKYDLQIAEGSRYGLVPDNPQEWVDNIRRQVDKEVQGTGKPSRASIDGTTGDLVIRNENPHELIGIRADETELSYYLVDSLQFDRESRERLRDVRAEERYRYDPKKDLFLCSFRVTGIKFRYGNGKTAADCSLLWSKGVEVQEAPDPRKVRIALKLEAGRSWEMSGEWRTPSNSGVPQLGQRSGAADLRAGELFGKETWTRHQVLGVLVLDPQQEFREGTGPNSIFRYPFGPEAPGYAAQERTLFVYGRNLTDLRLRPIRLAAGEEEGVSYDAFVTRSNDPNLQSTESVVGSRGWLVNKGWELLGDRAKGKDWDALLVQALLEPDVLPGLKTLTLENANGQGVWPLAFSDFTGSVAFVRKVGGDYEPAPVLFRPETVYLEVQTSINVPMDEIPVLLGHQGQPLIRLQAKQQPTERIGNRSLYRFRTKEIRLVDPRKTEVAVRNLEDRVEIRVEAMSALAVSGSPTVGLQARIGVACLLPPTPFFAKRSAEEIATRPVVESSGGAEGAMVNVPIYDAPSRIGLTWKEALLRVAQTKGEPIENLAEYMQKPSKIVSNVIITEFSRRKLTVTNGDHAAMLILKEGFQRIIEERIQTYRKPVTRDQIRALYQAFRQIQENLWRDGGENDPLGRVRVKGVEGRERPLYLVLGETYLREKFGSDEKKKVEWSLQAIENALQVFRDSHEQVVAKLRDCKDDDVDTLLQITGCGFESIISLTLPRMLELKTSVEERRDEWVPDRAARAQIANVLQLGAAVQAQKSYSSFDTTFVQILSLPIQIWAGLNVLLRTFQAAWVFYYVDIAVNVTDLAILAGRDVPEHFRAHEELRFAIGSSAILGTHRLLAAEVRADATGPLALDLILGSVGVFGFLGDIHGVYKGRRIFQTGKRVLPELEKGGAKALENLGQADQYDVAQYLKLSLELQDELGLDNLSDIEKGILKVFCKLEEVDDPVLGKVQKYVFRPQLDDSKRAGKVASSSQDPGASAAPEELIRRQARKLDDDIDILRTQRGRKPIDLSDPAAKRIEEIPNGSIKPVSEAPTPHQRFLFEDVDGEVGFHRVGDKLGEGVDVQVFDLLEPDLRIARMNVPGVMKFPKNQLKEAVEKGADFPSNIVPSSPWEITRDVLHGYVCLLKEKIPQLQIYHASLKHELSYFIQEKLPAKFLSFQYSFQDGKLSELVVRQGKTKTPIQELTPGMQRSILELYQKLAKKGLIWEDGHLENLYLKPLGGDKFEAGILDSDRILRFGKVPSDRIATLLKRVVETPNAPGIGIKSVSTNKSIQAFQAGGANFFMEKMLEYKRFISYDRQTRQFQKGLMDPKIVEEFFPDFAKHVID